MKDLNSDHFSPSTAVIDPKYTLTRTPDPNFSFAFNNKSSSTISSRSRLWPTPTPIQGGISHNLETIGEVVAVERIQKPGPGCRGLSARVGSIQTSVLKVICEVVQDHQRNALKLTVILLDSCYLVVKDAERVKVNIYWLRSQLDEIGDATNWIVERKKLSQR
ncbi:hypothetical protein BC332_00334 [Capsicum chinense]|nr:hypothetical protein BC332_00334 [Capsicum chinense]